MNFHVAVADALGLTVPAVTAMHSCTAVPGVPAVAPLDSTTGVTPVCVLSEVPAATTVPRAVASQVAVGPRSRRSPR